MESQLLIDQPSFTASGRARAPERGSSGDRRPLIVAIHGGGFTSHYFDVPGYSLIERATARGYGIIALDRLGHGRSRADGDDVQTLAANAKWISEAIDRLWPQFEAACAGVVIVGHSIGGALAVMVSAEPQTWPIAGVAVSGVALTPNPALAGYFDTFPEDTWVEPPAGDKDRLMLGNVDDFKSGLEELLHPAYVPVATRELLEINTVWPRRAAAQLKALAVPLQFRLAEQDVFWVANGDEVRKVSDLTSGVAGSSAAIVRHSGHCIDFHNVGVKFQNDQLNFASECCQQSAAI